MRPRIFWIGFLILSAAVTWFSVSGLFDGRWAAAGGASAIDYPAQIDLGDREIGEHVTVPIAISNHGKGVLIVSDVRTNCSCSGLERREDGQFTRIQSLEIDPGGRADLIMRVVVRGQAGGPMHNSVGFRTNHPARPEGHMLIAVQRILGGVFSTPNGFYFGTILMGTDKRQILDIRDMAVRPRAITRVESSDPENVAVQLLPANHTPPDAKSDMPGAVVGRVEVVVQAKKPQRIEATVGIHLDNGTRAPAAIPVVGRVAELVEASPACLVLPRA